MDEEINRSEVIQKLNDAVRCAGPMQGDDRQWLVTPGVLALGPVSAAQAAGIVQTYNQFDEDNDPYGEHDFGVFDLASQRLFWKIDYYDRTLTCGSPDPTDPAVTCRVLTILLASEY